MPKPSIQGNLLGRRRASVRLVRRLSLLAGGGMLLQASPTTGCEQTLSDLAGALGNPVATGLGSGLATLIEALALNLFI